MLNLMSADKLRAELLALPAEERAELARALLQSLHQEADAKADAAWLAELDRRAEAAAGGTAKVVDWEKARERIATRLKGRRGTRSHQ
jgi:putative addiction module component (TIGR02574 family)